MRLWNLCRRWRSEVINYILARLRRIQRLHWIFVALCGRGGYEAPLQVIGRKRQGLGGRRGVHFWEGRLRSEILAVTARSKEQSG
jgi:hypothetical protein